MDARSNSPVLMGANDGAAMRQYAGLAAQRAGQYCSISRRLICTSRLVIRTFDPHVYLSLTVGVTGDGPRLRTKEPSMFKSQQYRAKAAEYDEIIKGSTDRDEILGFQELQDRFVSLADNEQGLADEYDKAVHAAEQDRSHGITLATEEELILRCLGAAVIMQWNALPTTLQREIFDAAGSIGKLLETAALRGQIARFLHNHKDDAGRGKLPPAEDMPADARSCTLALSRWDNEGGAVRDGLPI